MSVPSDGKFKFPGNLVSSIIFTAINVRQQISKEMEMAHCWYHWHALIFCSLFIFICIWHTHRHTIMQQHYEKHVMSWPLRSNDSTSSFPLLSWRMCHGSSSPSCLVLRASDNICLPPHFWKTTPSQVCCGISSCSSHFVISVVPSSRFIFCNHFFLEKGCPSQPFC